MREAKDQATEAAEAEGYFNPLIEVTIDAAAENDRRTVHVKVEPGDPVRISEVSLEVTGPASTDPAQGTDAIAALRDTWSLPKGAQFRQTQWDNAKRRAVSVLASTPYAAARIAKSEAVIDPQKLSAALSVELNAAAL